MRRLVLLLALLLFSLADPVWPASKCLDCPRDARGRIARDSKAVREFKRAHPKPAACRSCQVHHVVPLYRGGADTPGNMEWVPKAQHRERHRRR